MAKERNLPSKATLTKSDFIRVVGSDNASYKQPVNAVLNGIPSITSGLEYVANTDFDTLTYGRALVGGSNSPTGNSAHLFYVNTEAYMLNADGTVNSGFQVAYSYFNNTEIFIRRKSLNASWDAWQKVPTRAEIDASTTIVTPTDIYSNITLQGGYVKFGKIVTVNITVTATSAITPTTNLFSLPAPAGGSAGILGASPTTGKSANMFYVQTQGWVRNYYGMAQNETIVITGSYIAS